MQDDKTVWWKQPAVISMQHRTVLSSWTFAETLSSRTEDKLSVVNRAAEANLCFFFFYTRVIGSAPYSGVTTIYNKSRMKLRVKVELGCMLLWEREAQRQRQNLIKTGDPAA